MPGRRSPKDSPAKALQNQLLWAQDPSGSFAGLDNWEPRGEEFTQALLAVLATGSAIFLRPGSGGRAIGIAIWEKDFKHDAQWCYDDEEINLWSQDINQRAEQNRRTKKDE